MANEKTQEVIVEQEVTEVKGTEANDVPAVETPKKGLIRKFGESIVKACDNHDKKKLEKNAKKAEAKTSKKHLTKGQKIGAGIAALTLAALGGGAYVVAHKPGNGSANYELGPDGVTDDGMVSLPESTEVTTADIPEMNVED